MSRSIKKGPYVDSKLLKKIDKMNNNGKKNVIKTFWYYQKYFERNRKYSLEEELPELYSSIKTV